MRLQGDLMVCAQKAGPGAMTQILAETTSLAYQYQYLSGLALCRGVVQGIINRRLIMYRISTGINVKDHLSSTVVL